MRARTGPRLRRPGGLARDEAGVAAIEFALLFPILLVIVAASVDISEALYARGKVTHIAASIAGFVADQKVWKASEVDDLLQGSTFVMAPYPTDGLRIRVSVLRIAKNGSVKVASSRALGTTALGVGVASPIDVPSAIRTLEGDIVLSQVDYAVKTPFAALWPVFAVRDRFEFSQYYFARPRRSDTVTIE